MKMTNRKRACITVLALFMFFTILPPFTAAADTIDDIIAEMEEMYQYIDEADKAAIQDARSEIQSLEILATDHEDWEAIFGISTGNNLITPEVIAAFGGDESAARDAAKSFIVGLTEIYYTADSADMTQQLQEFRENHRDTFHTLFGSEVTVDIVYDFFMAAKGELPQVIASSSNYINDLAFGSDQDLIDTMPDVLGEAMQNVLEAADPASGIGILNGKLGDIGWSMSKLVAQQKVIGDLIDPDLAARIAVAKALVRSQTELYIYENETETLQPKDANKEIHLTQDAGSTVEYRLKIMGREASTLVDFSSSDPSVATIEYTEGQGYPATKAIGAGTATIYAYRDFTGASPDSDWILKFDVTVEEGQVDVTLRGYATWLKSSDDAGITITAKQGDNVIATTITDANGLFELELPDGTYTIELSKAGYLTRTIGNVEIAGVLVNISSEANRISLIPGNVNGDIYVNPQDLSLFLNAWGGVKDDPVNGAKYNEAADFNGDNMVNPADLSLFLNGWGATVDSYEQWTW